jgi:hypothetical protein
MSNFLALLIVVIIASLVGLGFLVWMVQKYYWGPTGLPPSMRYGKSESDSECDSESTESDIANSDRH